ncbi:hypothetical protein [Micromonospora pisi]|uniref:hypothetical protein n=1 Tax=Micromonospora pisi TaxID=589240 RepID=UPI0014775961|nr:hypothetical protein [Micromonospora pisi]
MLLLATAIMGALWVSPYAECLVADPRPGLQLAHLTGVLTQLAGLCHVEGWPRSRQA